MDLTALTLAKAAELVRTKKVSPVELTRAHLDRIRRVDPALNSFLTVTEEIALEQAKSAEQAVQQENHLGPLHGIPVALKDLFETKGIRTTAGSLFFKDHVPDEDATLVQRLATAGAVLLGKLNLHEWAGGVTNENPHYGNCNNPWDVERIPGGSSGGCGAALAAELCLGAYGSDSGGSIRIPASLCGVVGLKPTYGRISLKGAVPLSWHLDHAGPMARVVHDVALLLQAAAGYDPDDPACAPAPVDDFAAGLAEGVEGWRIGLAQGPYFEQADPEVRQAVEAAALLFEGLGARVTAVQVEEAADAWRANGSILLSDAAAFHHQRLKSEPEKFSPDIRERLQTGAGFKAVDYAQARRTQHLLRRHFERLFNEFDLLLTPATPVAALVRDGTDAVDRARLLTRFTAPFNLIGLPALSLPCGFNDEGLPLGLQLVAGPWQEARVLQAGHAYERATPWHLLKPVI